MANYVIGDIQGCFDEYSLLLNKIKFDSKKDFIWLTGDLINRGPASLSVLKHVYDNRKAIKTVLGNHDLHFLAIYYGVRNKYRNSDGTYKLNYKGKYKGPDYSRIPIQRYTGLLWTNSNYYDTIGLLSIPYRSDTLKYKEQKNKALDEYKKYIDNALYTYEHRGVDMFTPDRANIVSIYEELSEESELDIQIVTIKDFWP